MVSCAEARICDLRGEIVIFLRQQNFMASAEKFSQEDINAKIAYLGDIFDPLNCLEFIYASCWLYSD